MQEAAMETGRISGGHLADQIISGKFLTLDLAGEEYGLEVVRVREIIGIMKITPVPRTPDFVLGVINLRGKVFPVVDLRLKFGLPAKEHDERTCIIVVEVEHGGGAVSMGIVVDRVLEVLDIKPAEVEPAPKFGLSVETDFILGVAKLGDRVKMLLNIDRVLTEREVSVLAEM